MTEDVVEKVCTEITELLEEYKKEANLFYNKNNNSAAARARKILKKIKDAANNEWKNIQNVKNKKINIL